jgi:hypothetical protein
VLVLPGKLEEFEFHGHAQDLLSIDRVVALEPPRRGRRKPASQILAVRQARRLRFPGRPRVVVLFQPQQYHLARALAARHEAELWYVQDAGPEPLGPDDEEELKILDGLAREVAAGVITPSASGDPRSENQPLRARLVELEIISSRPFIPGARIHTR